MPAVQHESNYDSGKCTWPKIEYPKHQVVMEHVGTLKLQIAHYIFFLQVEGALSKYMGVQPRSEIA